MCRHSLGVNTIQIQVQFHQRNICQGHVPDLLCGVIRDRAIVKAQEYYGLIALNYSHSLIASFVGVDAVILGLVLVFTMLSIWGGVCDCLL